ncbi:hypothetical protein AVEN_87155-1 [Araneus ventricosus]|uniref:Uncharacterized protein n=1 Tax=Araneus ventricosus TaxID=182803 RepID=A0A4Y2GZG8_ARAVE|nr:hypothetical protein AVEN_87155-1 [Araneus ventricosus]
MSGHRISKRALAFSRDIEIVGDEFSPTVRGRAVARRLAIRIPASVLQLFQRLTFRGPLCLGKPRRLHLRLPYYAHGTHHFENPSCCEISDETRHFENPSY